LCHTGLVWGSAVDGRALTFHLVGINNQNFVMQDEETGTWWQQVSGEAILGPLKGKRLTLIPADQLTYATWRSEAPQGRVLAPDARIAAANRYARADWEARIQKTAAPLSAASDPRLPPRALVVGIEHRGAARAYPVEHLVPSGVVMDDLGGDAIAIVRAPDGRSTRVFSRTLDGRVLDLVAKDGAAPFRLLDTTTGSEWDFSGAAVAGPDKGKQLVRLPFLEEYWFDWKTYHPSTDVARHTS
jgi:Protein of unknown function (DUF3179)